MQYKNFILDQFQIDSIASIEKGNSVVVSAATGTGKTLIADYIVDKFMKEGRKVFYTAPIKALSNQKFRDFKQEYGEHNVGLMTGDVVINATAPVVIMTTEIYRNMLLTRDDLISDLRYVVFDEIHYINDIERGTIWEESVIFSPPYVRFLCLSATIPNAKEFAAWIESIKKHTVDVVRYEKRAVPLEHYVFDAKLGLTRARELEEDMKLDKIPRYEYMKGTSKKRHDIPQPPSHLELVRVLSDNHFYPCLFFVFSRKATEEKAVELARTKDFTTAEQKKQIITYFSQHLDPLIKSFDSTYKVRRIIEKGIAFHHAGLLPNLKEIIENLFGMGLISILYATETFAVGINMPAKAVCFNTLDKFDGITFRYLNSKEYFQMAGRAGRRGIDKIGRSIAIIDRMRCNIQKVEHITSKDTDPIISQFKLSYNTVLNLIHNHTPDQIETILKSNFDYFLRKKQNKQVRIMASYNNKYRELVKFGYIQNGGLTPKGIFATHIYSNELLISEIFGTKLHERLSEVEINVIICSINYEARRGTKFAREHSDQHVRDLVRKLGNNQFIEKNLNKNNVKDLLTLITYWSTNCQFETLLEMTNLKEGDLIRLFRQIIDSLRQIRRASQDLELIHKVNNCITRIDRDVVQVKF